jgi:hypothetical protein
MCNLRTKTFHFWNFNLVIYNRVMQGLLLHGCGCSDRWAADVAPGVTLKQHIKISLYAGCGTGRSSV